MTQIEVQIDRLVGPTHHFGGLGVGNVASQTHAGQVSNPAAAALQGLDKMRLVASHHVPQLLLAPQPRPDYRFLRSLGFAGSEKDVLRRAAEEAPHLLSAATSCSAMWTANAATVTSGVDAAGETALTTLTIANLDSSLHRAIEPDQTLLDLNRILPSECQIYPPLPGGAAMRDEGAANHMRLGFGNAFAGINLFVYGDGDPSPSVNWPRQSLTACRSIARLHDLPPENTFFLKQHPDAIDAGAFHNDVVAMSHTNLLVHHELAFLGAEQTLEQIEDRFLELNGSPLKRIEVHQDTMLLEDAVETYLFNSQIITPGNHDQPRSASHEQTAPVIICTAQVRRHDVARGLVDAWCDQGHFAEVQFVDLNQSMSGGGGPACLRLRVPLPESAIPIRARWSTELDQQLRESIDRNYATRLTIADLSRIDFHRDAARAQQHIAEILINGGA